MPDVAPDDRVLVVAPTPIDAALTQSVLGEAGLRSEVHASCATLVESMRQNAGALLLTELAVFDVSTGELAAALRSQPPWSDIPVVLLAGGGTDSPTAIALLESLGNVTVLERPTHVVTLISSLRSAIKARRRQYELRDRIAALEKAEANVRDSEREFRRLVETSMEGIWQVDLDGHTRYVNQRLCTMLGRTRDEMFALPLDALFHPDDIERVADRVRGRATLGGDTHEWRLRRSDGAYIWVLSSATPVRDASDTLVGAFAMMTDITDRKQSEEALREATRRKDEFIAVLAHELRNPLAPVRSSLEIMRHNDGATPPLLLDMLDRQVNHMVHLVDELLEISRISTCVIELHKQPVTLASVVDTAVDASAPNIRSAGHRLDVDLPPHAVVLNVDAVRLSQVLTNLLNNAAKYTDRGGHVFLSARVCDDAHPNTGNGGPVVDISVRDTGVGISSDNLLNVFEMFSQVDRQSGRAHHGLGIGLALARNLVQLHGGTIVAQSAGLGRGSEFIVRLPYDPHDAALMRPDATDAHDASPRPLDHFHVLVVDDNRDAADSLAALLRASGASVDVTYDGRHALALWREHHHPIVLLDVGMPEMDGNEVATRIRREPEGRHSALIAITGWGQRADRLRTSAAGFNHHLVKPIEFSMLQRLLVSLTPEGVA